MTHSPDPYELLAKALSQVGTQPAAPFLTWGYLDSEDHGLSLIESQVRLVDKAVAKLSFARKAVIDIGCGRGGTCHHLASHHKPRSVLGVDLSPANISACQRQFSSPKLRFQLADATNLPQREHSFDAAINIESSGAYPELLRFFKHCARILRPNGTFVYVDVLPAALVADIEQALTAIGFALTRSESIREGVLRARAQLGPRSFAAIKPHLAADLSAGEREDLHNYFALPGSKMFAGLETGALDYIVIHAVKNGPNRAASAALAAIDKSLRRRAALLRQILSGKGDPVFALGQPRPNATCHVFALPYGGGGASIYRSWAQSSKWPAKWAFCPLQLPGRENRLKEPAFTDMDACLDHLIAAISPYTAGPWALVGCSLGCKIAFELARHFASKGQPPVMMLLMACPAPSVPVAYPDKDLDSEDIANRVHHLGGTPQRIVDNVAALEVFAKALNGDLKLAQSYLLPRPDQAGEPRAKGPGRPRYRPGKLTVQTKALVVYAADDHLVSPAQIKAWRHHLRGELSFKEVSGGHFFLRELRPKLEAELVAALSPLLSPPPKRMPEPRRKREPGDATHAAKRFPYGDPYKVPKGATLALCFHHAGANAGFWRSWLPVARRYNLHLCPYELPGHSTRLQERCLTTIDAVLADLAPICAKLNADPRGAPMVLFGHSLGALIAFAVAQSLTAGRLQRLFVSGRLPPQQQPPAPLRHTLSDQQLAAELIGLGGTPKEVLASPELLAMVLPILRADFAITETFALPSAAQQQRALPLTVLGGRDDAEVSVAQLRGWLQWGDETSTCQLFAGDHFYLQGRETELLALIAATVRDTALISTPV